LFADAPRMIRRRAADDAIARIKTMILDGELQPFDRLPGEQDLATALGVSRPTAREAVGALVALNILEVRHGDGTYVTSLEPKLLVEPMDFLLSLDRGSHPLLMESRRVLESGITALAAERAGPADVAALTRIADSYRANLSDVQACIALDREFHEEVARVAGNQILATMMSTLSAMAQKSRQQTARSLAVRKRSDLDHREILAAVRAADPARASLAMSTHLFNVGKPGN
jgi:GntR family transcriptional repressor for pyruvate dehydrogenase complex